METVKSLETALEQVVEYQKKLIGECEKIIFEYDAYIEPVRGVMRKYGVPFKNPVLDGQPQTKHGPVVGASGDKVYVYLNGVIRIADAAEDQLLDEVLTVGEYIKCADLGVIKAGFQYVANLTVSEGSEFIVKRNNELKNFLNERGL